LTILFWCFYCPIQNHHLRTFNIWFDHSNTQISVLYFDVNCGTVHPDRVRGMRPRGPIASLGDLKRYRRIGKTDSEDDTLLRSELGCHTCSSWNKLVRNYVLICVFLQNHERIADGSSNITNIACSEVPPHNVKIDKPKAVIMAAVLNAIMRESRILTPCFTLFAIRCWLLVD
jgi:hypothetical protein